MKLEECFDKGLLRRKKVGEGVVLKEMDNARRHLDNARKCLNDEMYDLAVVSVYTAMFHAARSILFRDGIKERSHICIIAYLRERYPALGEQASVLDNYRRSRHTMLYGIDVEMLREDAEEGIRYAAGFIGVVENILASSQAKERT